MPNVQHKRGTRAALEALALDGDLVPWQIYALTDEVGRLCIATAADAYSDIALKRDTSADFPRLIVARDAGDGTNNAFQNIGAAFTTIQVNSVSVDTSGGWDNANYSYVVPSTGIYDCSAKMRTTDNTGARNQGLGIDIDNQDSASFVWGTFPTTSSVNRFVLQNRRVFRANAGQRIRIFGYDAGNVNKAELVLMKVAS